MNYAITLLTFQKIFVAVFLSKFCRQNDCRQSDFRQKVPVGKIIVDKVIVGKMIVGQVIATPKYISTVDSEFLCLINSSSE